MNFWAVSFKINLKRLVKPSSVILAAILTAAMAIGQYVQNELYLQAVIGVCYNVNSDISTEIVENLKSFSGIEIKEYDSLKAMTDDIIARKIECGYAFDKNIDKYIESGLINRAARLYKSSATTAGDFTNELVFAALMKCASPYIASNYLSGKASKGSKEILPEAKEAVGSYYESGVFMDMEIIPVGAPASASVPNRRICAGIGALFLFIVFFYVTIGVIEEKKLAMYEKLSRRDSLLYSFSYIAAYAAPLWVAVSLFFLSQKGIMAFAATGAYVVFLSLISLIAAALLDTSKPLYAVFPIASVAVILLGGAFFDPGAIIPFLGEITKLSPIHYFTVYMM